MQIAIDDFGTGYSSLQYLRRFPIDCLKVDRSFVRGLPQSSEDAAIVGAVVELGHTLGLSVTAEGIETGAQLAALRPPAATPRRASCSAARWTRRRSSGCSPPRPWRSHLSADPEKPAATMGCR